MYINKLQSQRAAIESITIRTQTLRIGFDSQRPCQRLINSQPRRETRRGTKRRGIDAALYFSVDIFLRCDSRGPTKRPHSSGPLALSASIFFGEFRKRSGAYARARFSPPRNERP